MIQLLSQRKIVRAHVSSFQRSGLSCSSKVYVMHHDDLRWGLKKEGHVLIIFKRNVCKVAIVGVWLSSVK